MGKSFWLFGPFLHILECPTIVYCLVSMNHLGNINCPSMTFIPSTPLWDNLFLAVLIFVKPSTNILALFWAFKFFIFYIIIKFYLTLSFPIANIVLQNKENRKGGGMIYVWFKSKVSQLAINNGSSSSYCKWFGFVMSLHLFNGFSLTDYDWHFLLNIF